MSEQSPVKPYDDRGDKKEQVEHMFDSIARHYDFLNGLLSLGIDRTWRQRLIDQLVPEQHRRLLDVATGTADVAIQTAKRLEGVTHITGLDLSHQMLAIGRKKVASAQLDEKIKLVQGDSENLPFADNTFDAVTVAFGVRNFGDLNRGLQEMQRVLRPGGKLVILEFSRPRVFPFRQIFNFYFANILPAIGRLQSKDQRAYRYLYESVQAFPDGDQFIQRLHQNGYNSTQCISLTLGVCSIYTALKSA